VENRRPGNGGDGGNGRTRRNGETEFNGEASNIEPCCVRLRSLSLFVTVVFVPSVPDATELRVRTSSGSSIVTNEATAVAAGDVRAAKPAEQTDPSAGEANPSDSIVSRRFEMPLR
jgi:hypothetical protein